MGLFRALRERGIKGADAARGIARGLRPVSSFGDISVGDHENGVNVGRQFTAMPYAYVGTARITDAGPDGESDFKTDDPRYWLEWLMPIAASPASSSDSSEIWAFGSGSFIETLPNIGFNLAEVAPSANEDESSMVKGCHLLSVGTPVDVFAMRDDQNLPRLVFVCDPSPVRVRIVNDTGCGKQVYNGKALKNPTADLDKSDDALDMSLGDDGPDCVVVMRASGGLVAANDIVIGRLAYVNADGTPFIQVGVPAGFFPVKVRRDDGGGSGALGSLATSTDCTVTYALYTLGGTAITGATGKTPDRNRYPTCAYTPAANDTIGIAYHDSSGVIQLADAFDERATTATIDVPTTFEVDDVTYKLKWAKTPTLVLDKGEEGELEDLYTGEVCS